MRRLIDLTGASILSVLLSPVLAGLALAIRFSMGRPILFRQQRPGYKGEPFEVYKFRTMKDAVDADGEPLPDEERLTIISLEQLLGQFVRISSDPHRRATSVAFPCNE